MLSTEEMHRSVNERLSFEKKMQNKEYDNYEWDACPTLARFIGNSKITSRWWERRIANLLDWKTDPTADNDDHDYGDLIAPPYVLALDNVELKCREKPGKFKVAGGQLRYFEDIPWYMFWTLDDDYKGHCYMFNKNDIWNEIFKYKSHVGSPSQVSGQVTGLDDDGKRKLINETYEKKNKILWGFGLTKNKNNIEIFERWDEMYKIDIESLKGENGWKRFKESRGV